ncbi:MAG: site-2 protease family protein [Planctomycetaceae bacterium]
MMFGPVQTTPYDLRFSLFGIPVRVLPWFWLMAALLGQSTMDEGLPALGLWIFAVFISILVHEFGHALSAVAFGYPPQVVLYQFGGMALYSPGREYSLWQSILITAAGPLAGLALSAISMGVIVTGLLAEFQIPEGLGYFLNMMFTINLFWSILNLLPVLPLDGGQICRDVLKLITPRNGLRIALVISVVVGGLVAAAGVAFKEFYLAILFGVMAISAVQQLQQRQW